jgi:hypothetical protein
MCAVSYKNRIDTGLFTPLVEEEKVTDDGSADGHHTGKAKSSESAGADQSGKVGREGRSDVTQNGDDNCNKGDRSATINVRERRPKK